MYLFAAGNRREGVLRSAKGRVFVRVVPSCLLMHLPKLFGL